MNSVENDEGGLDLYDDILVEDLTCRQESLHEVENKYQEAVRRIAVLEDITGQNETDLTNLKKKNAYLMKNISVLYKTACVELERKKDIIESLQNQINSGLEYEYAEKCRPRMPTYPYGSNIFEPQNVKNHRPNEETIAPYDHPRWDAQDISQQYGDSHPFYPPHSSIYLNDSITASHIDAHHSTQDYPSPYSSSNIPHEERSEKHIPHNSHAAHMTESTHQDSYTPPIRNTDSHTNTRDSSSRASEQSRFVDEHTPHTKQTDRIMPHGKHSSVQHSSRKQSGSTSSYSKHPSSKTSTSSHSDKRSSSSKNSHSDSRKGNSHSSSSRPSEPPSSQSKHSKSKTSGRSSRVSSKDREPSTSSSTSSSRSRHQQSQIVEVRDLRRSNSSDNKHRNSQSEKCREQKAPVESYPTEEENFVDSKRKLPCQFSELSKSKHKRRHKEKSKSAKESVSCSSRKEKRPKSHRKGQEDCGDKTKYKNVSLTETDKPVNLERNDEENSYHHVLEYDGVHESPVPIGQDLETDQGTPMEMSDMLVTDTYLDSTLQEEVTESQSLESVTREADDTIVAAPINTSSNSGNSDHESDIANNEGDVEKEHDKCEQLDIEINEPCSSVLWAGKELSDSDENSVCLEDGTTSEVDKLESLSDTHLSSKKEENSGHTSDVSDAKSDTSDYPKNRSIIIQCFGSAHDDSPSPIIIPCYPSKKSKSKSCSSASDSDEECDSEDHTTSTPSKRLIARSLFPLTQPGIDKSPEVIEGCMTPEVQTKQNRVGALDSSIRSKAEDDRLEKADATQESEISCSSDVSDSRPSKRCRKLELNNNLDMACSPILEKLSDDLMLTAEEINNSHWLNKDIETASSTKEDYHSDTSLDNDNENCYRQITDAQSLDKKDTCSDDDLEEGELLSDEENESIADAVATTARVAKIRSPVRYHKSFSPLDRRKNHSKWNRETYWRRPRREPMKSDPHNRLRSSPPNHFVPKVHCPSAIGKHSQYRDGGRRWQNRLHSSGSSRSRSRQLDGNPGQSDSHHNKSSRSSSGSANRKRRTH